MQMNFSPDAGRPTVVSAKVPADIVDIIDFHARSQLLARSGWLRKAIISQLDADIAALERRPDPFGLEKVMG